MFWHLGLGVQFLLGLSCSCKQVLPSVCLCVSASIHIPIMCYDKHLKWMFECKLRRLISILSTAFSSVVSTVLFFISVPKRHPVSMFVWHMFRDSLQIFFCILSFWPQDNFPVPNENKKKYLGFAWAGIHRIQIIHRIIFQSLMKASKKYLEFAWAGIHVGAGILRRKRRNCQKSE